MSGPPLAVSGQCSLGDGNPLGDLCQLIADHTNGNGVLGPAVGRLLWAVIVLVALILLGRIVGNVVEHTLERSEADRQIRTLVHNLVTIGTLVIAVIGAVTGAGLSISIALTFGGLTSLAIGLAFQDLLRNVLAGIFLLIERPFRLGDMVTVADLTGTVETIELRTTALRLPDGRLAVLPNLSVFSNSVINATAYDARQYTVSVWVPAGADLAAVIGAARKQLEATEGLAEHPEPRVQPSLEIDGGVTLKCQYWLHYRDQDPDALAADLVSRLYSAVGEQLVR